MFTYFFTYFSVIIRNSSIIHSRCLSRGTDCKVKEIAPIIGLLLIELFEVATLLLLGLLLFEKLSPSFAAIEDRAVVWLKIASRRPHPSSSLLQNYQAEEQCVFFWIQFLL